MGKVKTKKIQEIENGIAKLKNNTRFVTGKKLPSKVKQDFPRAFLPWSPEEDKAVVSLYKRRVPISEISNKHKRQNRAVRYRLMKLLQRYDTDNNK